LSKTLRLFTDGAARGNPGPAGAGVVLEDDQGMRLAGCHRWLGDHRTNNEAEYLALIDGLRLVADWKPDRLEVFMDSKLVVEQLKGVYRVKDAKLKPLHQQAKAMLDLHPYSIEHVEREKNKGADALANRAIDEHVQARGSRG
jgi:ribonuclease HI